MDARGFDISEYAISQVPETLRPFCTLGSITDEIDGRYDLISCIEVLEHLPPEHAERAIENLATHTDRILFSSTPNDDREPTHVNVQQPDAWVHAFAERGFFPRPSTGAIVLSPQAIVFERREPLLVDEVAAHEVVRYRLARGLQEAVATAEEERASAEEERAKTEEQRAKADDERDAAATERARVTDLEQRLSAAELEASVRSGELDRLQGRTETAEATAARVASELAELRATTWWRIGRPVRGAVTWLRVRRPTGRR